MRKIPVRQRGFTLVEMLTVIAIIVLLAGMLLPAVAEAQRRIHASATRAQIRALETAVNGYRAEWRDYPLSGPTNNASPDTFSASDGAAQLYKAVAKTFTVSGVNYGPYYSLSDDERSTSQNSSWTDNGTTTGNPYIVDKIPPGMPILYYRANSGRSRVGEVFAYEHCLNTNVRPPSSGYATGVTLANHYSAGQGSAWARNADASNPSPILPTGMTATGGKANFFATPSRISEASNSVWVENPRWGVMASGTDLTTTRPAKEGSFLLVSSGLDRRYGTRDDPRNSD